ncbi:1,4-dihydroxy-2-naphthoate octaprenyltransferase [bacterium]|nr:1,4-dihydroxy-2-naphthoate octaprenyltransferase [bacterium]
MTRSKTIPMSVWVGAARLRTLPLAVAGIVLGSLLAAASGGFRLWVALGCVLLAVLFQVLSNFANDYGDGVRGTDALRTGEPRMLASGRIDATALFRSVVLLALLASLASVGLSYFALRSLGWAVVGLFWGLGGVAVWAAIRYTMGKTAYGYKALGDVAVFLFFGWLAVGGSAFVQTLHFDPRLLLPASALGALSTGVLNLNNMRDIETDRVAGKKSLAMLFGLRGAKWYQAVLVLLAFDAALLFQAGTSGNAWKYLFLMAFVPLLYNLNRSFKARTASEFDVLLKPMALSTLLFAILMGLGSYWSQNL